jgi:hypothetical protein
VEHQVGSATVLGCRFLPMIIYTCTTICTTATTCISTL